MHPVEVEKKPGRHGVMMLSMHSNPEGHGKHFEKYRSKISSGEIERALRISFMDKWFLSNSIISFVFDAEVGPRFISYVAK